MKSFEAGYTGRMFESEVLPRLSDEWRREGYFDESKSYKWVKENQTWNPSDPDNKTANELHYRVAEKLGLENVNDLKLYSALNSPLDYHYGIDAFFELGDVVYTLDLSINPHKDVAKADMVIHESELHDEVEFNKLVEMIADRIKNPRVSKIREAA